MTSASFIIKSASLAENDLIPTQISSQILNSALSYSSNNTLFATHFTVTDIQDNPNKKTQTRSTISVRDSSSTPVPRISNRNIQYSTSVSFEIDQNINDVTIEMKTNIRNETSQYLNIDISRVSILLTSLNSTISRRLLATQVSYTISSETRSDSDNIEFLMSLSNLNAILSKSSDNFLTARNLQVTTEEVEINEEKKPKVSKSSLLLILVVIGLALLVVLILIFGYYGKKSYNENHKYSNVADNEDQGTNFV